MIVLDAGVLIAHLDGADAFHRAAVAFLEENEGFEFAANALTVAESLVHPTAGGRAAEFDATLERLRLVRIDLVADDIRAVAQVRAATRLRMPDALVLFTAERHGGEIVTTDHRLARVAQERGVGATALTATTSHARAATT